MSGVDIPLGMQRLPFTLVAMSTREVLGISQARVQLGPLVGKAVHGHKPTVIQRSSTERGVLISEEEYEEYLRLKREAAGSPPDEWERCDVSGGHG